MINEEELFELFIAFSRKVKQMCPESFSIIVEREYMSVVTDGLHYHGSIRVYIWDPEMSHSADNTLQLHTDRVLKEDKIPELLNIGVKGNLNFLENHEAYSLKRDVQWLWGACIRGL